VGRLTTKGLGGYAGLACAILATAVDDARDGVAEAREWLRYSDLAADLTDLLGGSYGMCFDARDLDELVDDMSVSPVGDKQLT